MTKQRERRSSSSSSSSSRRRRTSLLLSLNHYSKTTTNIKQQMLRRLRSTTTITSGSETQQKVIFNDPCSMCGTKKRRASLSPIFKDFSSIPRKKLSFTSSPSSLDSFHSQTSSCISSYSFLKSPVKPQSPAKSLVVSYLGHLGSFSSSTTGVLDKESSPAPPQSPAKSPVLGHLGSFSDSTTGVPSEVGSPAYSPLPPPRPSPKFLRSVSDISSSRKMEGSPVSASRPPRPPKLDRSVSDINPRSLSSEMIFASSPDQKTGAGGVISPAREESSATEESWKKMKECLALMNKVVNGIASPKEEEAEEICVPHNKQNNKDVNQITGGEEIVEYIEGEGNAYFTGNHKCSCGKRFRIFWSKLPDLNK